MKHRGIQKYNTLVFFALLAGMMIGPIPVAFADLWRGKQELYDCPNLQEKSIATGYGEMFQGYDGWFFKHNDFDAFYTLSPQTEDYLKRFNDALVKNNTHLIIFPVLFPKAFIANEYVRSEELERFNYDKDEMLQAYEGFADQLSGLGVGFADVSPSIKKLTKDQIDNLFFKIDFHWKPEGAALIASSIADEIKKLPSYDSLNKAEFSSIKDGALDHVSTSQEYLRQICVSHLPPEKINIYKFNKEEENSESIDALFGEQELPPVSVVGSSFSYVDSFRLKNFIEKQSSLEVMNYAIPGGRLFTSIISYLNSDDFIKDKPPILLWEVASRYDLNLDAPTYFRQLIPAVSGECTGDKLVGQANVKINKDTSAVTVFSALEDQKISGKEYYLYIKADNPVFNRFHLDFEYEDGDGEFFTIDHSGRYKNSGRFFVELSEDIDTNLSGIALENRDDADVNLTSKLCKK